MQRHAMLMYTSCGWFFDELSGIETVQVIEYAARAIQMAQNLFGNHREGRFIELMSNAPTNIPNFMNGAELYRRFAKPAMVNLLGVGAHYAIKALFRGFEQHSSIYAYEVNLLDSRTLQAGRMRIALGRARIRSRITRDQQEVTFGVLHLGDNNVYAGVREYRGQSEYEGLLADSEKAFANMDIPDSIRALDRHFGQTSYSLKSLFKDERQRVVSVLLESVVNEAEAMYRQVYDNHALLMRFLNEASVALPKVLSVTSEFVINAALRRALESEPLDLARIASLLDAARLEKLNLDQAGLSYSLTGRVNSLMQAFAAMPDDINTLERMNSVFDVVGSLPFQPDLWRVQNVYYELMQTLYPKVAGRGDPASREWVEQFQRLGEKLGLALQNEHNQPSLPNYAIA
jgi:hypothetical protein